MKNTKLYSILIGIIPVIQIVFDTINTAKLDNNIRMIVGASLMLMLIILQGIERYLSPNIKNTSLWISVIASLGFIAGGILDNLQIVSLSENSESIIRLIFTLIVVISTTISKQFGYDENIYKEDVK